MLSRTGTYALQAALHLAQRRNGDAVSAAEMAEALELPHNYLAKVLREMGRAGLLDSTRGARGGYTLRVRPSEVSVAELVAPFDGFETPRTCLMGGVCDLDDPCTAHLRRVEWIESQRRILRETTLRDLLTER